MQKLARCGISLEQGLLKKFDRLIRERNYGNRSEAVRDLIRQELVRKQWHESREVAGAVTVVYDHHRRDLLNKLTDIQHDFQDNIICSQHVHLDHHNCLEIIAVKGDSRSVQKLAHMLRSLKGIKHGTLSMTSTGRDLE